MCLVWFNSDTLIRLQYPSRNAVERKTQIYDNEVGTSYWESITKNK